MDPGSAAFGIEPVPNGELPDHPTLDGAVLPERVAIRGIMIGPHAANKGCGSGAVETAVRCDFEQMGLNRIELPLLSENQPAHAACGAHAGFAREGVLRQSVIVAGGYHDQVVMGILPRDWNGTACFGSWPPSTVSTAVPASAPWHLHVPGAQQHDGRQVCRTAAPKRCHR